MGKWLKNGLKRTYKATLQRLAGNCRSASVRAEAHPNSGSRCICSSRRKVSARESRRSLLRAMNGNLNSPSASQQMSWHHLHMCCTCEGDRGRAMLVAASLPLPARLSRGDTALQRPRPGLRRRAPATARLPPQPCLGWGYRRQCPNSRCSLRPGQPLGAGRWGALCTFTLKAPSGAADWLLH